MSAIAIIPARGGSKRIPRKNIKDFLGKPIIAYSIQAAIDSGLFDEVMVSTDDEQIADVAMRYGAKVPFLRSNENANDFATTVAVLHEVLNDYKHKEKKQFDYGCCIYPTAPFTTKELLKRGFDLLVQQKFDSVFSAVAFGYPIWRGFQIQENGKMQMIAPQYLNTRSQDLPKVFHDAGQWYWFNSQRLLDTLFTNNASIIELSEQEVQDIDTMSDWKVAEIKYTALYGKQ